MTEVVRIDRDADDFAWAEARMDAFGDVQQTASEVARELAANWTEGRNVSRLYPDPRYPDDVRPMTLAMAIRRHWVDDVHPPVAFDGNYANKLANSAQIYLMAGREFEAVSAMALRPFGPPDKWTPETVQRTLRGVMTRFGNLDYSSVRAYIHPSKAPTPYWQQVIDNLSTGEHKLTAAEARNIIATAQHWLEATSARK
jgi:hypothetical protein